VPLEPLGLIDFFDGEYQVTSEVTTLPTPGHTPGHQAILISSKGHKAMIVGDVLHSKVQVQEPSWCARVDTNKDDSRRSREDLLNRAQAQNYIVAAGHFHPEEHLGRIISKDRIRYWRSL